MSEALARAREYAGEALGRARQYAAKAYRYAREEIGLESLLGLGIVLGGLALLAKSIHAGESNEKKIHIHVDADGYQGAYAAFVLTKCTGSDCYLEAGSQKVTQPWHMVLIWCTGCTALDETVTVKWRDCDWYLELGVCQDSSCTERKALKRVTP